MKIRVSEIIFLSFITFVSLNVKKTKYMFFRKCQKTSLDFSPRLTISGTNIERVKDFNFLGLVLNENLSWNSHIEFISTKVAKCIGIMNRLKRFLPPHILKTLYFTLVHSHLNYSLLAWGFNCRRIKLLQKKVIRIITVSKYNAHTEPLMKTLSILNIEDMFKLNILKWYYKYCHKQLPVYFQKFNILRHSDMHNYPTRNNSFIPRNVTRLHASRRCLRNHVSVVLNNTCDNIINKINTHSYEGFAAYVKKYIISSYSTECSIENCYVFGAWLLNTQSENYYMFMSSNVFPF